MKLAEIFVAVRPDTSKTGSEMKRDLRKIDPTAEGKQFGTRFGVGMHGALGSAVSRSAGIFVAGFAAVKVGGLIKDSINLEATFSQTMNTMAAVANVPKDQMKSLSDLALKMGADTTFSASEAGDAMLELAKGGMSAATIKAGGLQGTLQLAAAGGTSLAVASTIASNAMNTFALKGSDMASVAAALAGGANASSASVESLGQALSQVGPGAKTAGLTLQDTVGVLSSFDAAGIKGADSGTSLKTMLTRLVPQTKKASLEMESLGLKFTDAKGAFVPITNVAQQLKDKLGGLSAEQKTTALSTIFGSDATRAATVLMNQGAAGLGKFIQATKDQGAAQRVAAARMDGTAGALESFKGSVETAKLQLGLFLAPAIQGGLKILTNLLNGIVPAVKDVAGKLAADLVPVARDAAGFITTKLIPGIVTLATNFTKTLKPAVMDVFGFIKDRALPPLKDFAGFVGDKIAPKLASMATSLSKNKDFLVPFAAVILAVVAGMKAWAIVQAIMNIELTANPIGIVVVAIAALVAGVIWAYKNVGWFHDALVGAFRGIQEAVRIFAPVVKAAIGVVIAVFQLWWEHFAQPILAHLRDALGLAWKGAQTFARNFGAAFDAIKGPAWAAIKFVVGAFLGMVGDILDGAAKAFGWVPNLGDKLKTAAKAFGTFRDQVNNKLDGLKDHQVDFTIKYTSTGVNLSAPSSVGRRAAGGPAVARGNGKILGHGSPTSDNIDLRVSPTEWVIKGKSSAKYGDYAMGSVNDGTALIIPDAGKRAGGGRAGVYPADHFPSSGAVAGNVSDALQAIAKPVAKQIAKYGGNLMSTRLWGESQAGKPYGWGMGGPDAYDCSGFVGALINHAMGKALYSRIGATGSMPWPMFAPGPGRFSVGWFQGNPGHTAATIDGENFESAGGVGVRYGSRARGAANGLFSNLAHVKGFRDGGLVGEGRRGDGPFDLINPKGRRFLGKDMLEQLGVKVYDQGGTWPSGTLGANLSGKSETVVPGGGDVELGKETVRALGKAFGEAIGSGRFTLVQRGGSYVLQNSNG